MKNFIGVLICLFLWNISLSQGVVRGKITDENGETVIGAAVVLKSNKSYGVMTDFDGNYSLSIKDIEAQTIVISFIGYTNKEIVVTDITQKLNVKLNSNEAILKEVEIIDNRLTEKQRESALKKAKIYIEQLEMAVIKPQKPNWN
jgi:hypothetical protein